MIDMDSIKCAAPPDTPHGWLMLMHVDNPKTALLQHPTLQHNITASLCCLYA